MRLFCVVLLLAVAASGEVLDRIAVTVGTQVITESELLEEIRLNAFLNNEPAKLDAKARFEAADRLIEQKLVRKEMEMGRYPPASPQEADAMVEKLEKTRAASLGEFDRELTAAGITLDQLREHLLWGLALSHFVDLRFRPAVQVSRTDVQKYYADKVLPAVKAGQAANLDDMRTQIEETLTAERADREMDAWLKDARQRAKVEFHKDAFLGEERP
jgi:hypothetical protein